MPFTLHTPRLTLRDYRPEDWERVHLYAADPEFSRFEGWGPNTVQDTRNFVDEMAALALAPVRHRYELVVCLKDSGLLIGGCGIRVDPGSPLQASLGWMIHPQFQNQGYATEAVSALIRFGFETLGLELIFATCDARNTASARVMEKLGMRQVAFVRGERMQKGHLRDTLRYEMTPGDRGA